MSGDPIVAGYEANAEYWVEIVRGDLDPYHRDITEPALLRRIGDVPGQVIVDVGCGEGRLARSLAAAGAGRVYAVDNCAPLIDAALAAVPADAPITHAVADAAAMPIDSATADLVVANRIPHATTDPGARFVEFARVLRPGGRLIALSQHPCFYAGSEHLVDGRAALPVNEYFAGRVVRQHFSVAGRRSPAPSVQPIPSLSDYFAMITGAGFVVTALEEPRPTPEQFADRWWQENFTRPLFLLLECVLPDR
ncbi:class I SAM-dependent methyltransferase [Williamsia sp. CHRR-6]|uniref:class I SAM-dependent methyltransferase n=1 Tax=Williamsia sp. CHRR-6 TaxID=2835871 RepID=UPI001BD96AFA|nr:class I SAM-dependent methyltransferase [Williamsia sp. CHRR-6]MBT0567418.1 class I SAM-dependent methyltransferase [Williamsia sp. CHRR-6]